MPAKKTAPARAAATRTRKQTQAVVAASFDYAGPKAGGAKQPVWLSTTGNQTLIDVQKGRNNYYKMKGATQAAICRRFVEGNWFLRSVVPLRHASTIDGFDARDKNGKSMAGQYDFYSLVSDLLHEDLNTSNVVCIWRKGEQLPTVTVLDMEVVEYGSIAGIERIIVTYPKDTAMAKDVTDNPASAADYKELLGEKVYQACLKGGTVTFVKGREEDEWDFEVMVGGKRRGVFTMPELVSILADLDYLELMGVGDWNLAWFRKDVIRLIKKGYKVTNGQGAGVNSVDIGTKDIKDLGEGTSKINGNANVPANHDTDWSYLTVSPENFDPKQVEAVIERLMQFGGIEAVVLLGSFSQQNGAAPSLMRNARTMAFARRGRIENLLRRIFSADEFRKLNWGARATKTTALPIKFHWSVKSLYSIAELVELVSGTNDGTASPQTRREWLDLDNDTEVLRLKAAHADRAGYAPPFEAGQALLPAMFPDELGAAESTATPPGKPGRPQKVK